jgi:predicted Zn-dependent protease
MRGIVMGIVACALLAGAAAAHAQWRDILKKGASKVSKANDTLAPWSPEQESQIGGAAAAKLIHIFGLYEEPAAVKYVNLVGSALALHAPRQIPYHFAILDTEAITAMGMPGGYVFVTRGALANMANEAQLAGTLAHEIAHVDSRHLEKEVRSQKTRAWAFEEGSKYIPDDQLKKVADNLVNDALTLRVSRDKEDEADRKGTDLAAQTGYDPSGLRDFLAVLAKAAEGGQNKQQLGMWGTTHPPFDVRVDNLTKLLANYPGGGQQLAERYSKNVVFDSGKDQVASTPKAESPAPAAKGGGKEMDGVVSQGAVVLIGGELQPGARVKIASKGKTYDGVFSQGVVMVVNGKLAEGERVKVRPQ